jgi:hypothetical protein
MPPRVLQLLIAMLAFAIAFAFAAETTKKPLPAPPLEIEDWRRLPDSAQIDAFLAGLEAASDYARVIDLGTSAGGRPLRALLVSRFPGFLENGEAPAGHLKVMLIGSQHGTEPSGCEALQRMAIEMLDGRLNQHLKQMHFILVVNANPDGRDNSKRVNQAGCNLSTDFLLQSQPETRAITDCLQRYSPHVLLDLHESAVLKKKSLGAQGYMTDFEAQFEMSNNPNIDRELLQLGRETMLPKLILFVRNLGLPCRHYIGEITDIHQTLTHGGLSVRNIRNYAAMRGALAVLAENRLNPKEGPWPTYRNIRVRVAKQMLCVEALLDICSRFASEIIAVTGESKPGSSERRSATKIALDPRYDSDPGKSSLSLPMRRRESGELISKKFAYHSRIKAGPHMMEPATLYVTEHQDRIAELLSRHDVAFSRVEQSHKQRCWRQRVARINHTATPSGFTTTSFEVSEEQVDATVEPGTLRIDPDETGYPLVALMLDLRSSSSIFRSPSFEPLVKKGAPFFVLRSAPQKPGEISKSIPSED